MMKVYSGWVREATKKAGQTRLEIMPLFSLLLLSSFRSLKCKFTVPLIPVSAVSFRMLCALILVLVGQGRLLLCWLIKSIPQKVIG